MAIFFLLVGLEIKREMVEGELSSFKNASLPIFAAIGGMLVPAVIYSFFNFGTSYGNGWGIPMATDIAFSWLLFPCWEKEFRIPLKFSLPLGNCGRSGSYLVIAIFYTEQIHWMYLFLSLGILLYYFFEFLKVTELFSILFRDYFYGISFIIREFMLPLQGFTGIFTIPTNVSTVEISPLEKLEHQLHIPVSFQLCLFLL
jgi:NhaA family Na+:H+ antiporter